jgi:pimeloyl-ACP methyl ester carboxylesterase
MIAMPEDLRTFRNRGKGIVPAWIRPWLLALIFVSFGLPSLATNLTVSIEGDIAYGSLPQQKLDIYTPSSAAADAPVLVFFHGGSFRTGSNAFLRAVGESFARSGVIFVAPEYRQYPDGVFPQFVEDAASAVAYVWRALGRDHGSPRAIFVAGHSAGAYIAAMIALNQDYLAADGVPAGSIKGLIGIAGAYQPIPFDGSGLESIFPAATRARSAPAEFVDKNDPPMLLIAGATLTKSSP